MICVSLSLNGPPISLEEGDNLSAWRVLNTVFQKASEESKIRLLSNEFKMLETEVLGSLVALVRESFSF